MIERDDGVRPGLVEILQALHLEPVEGAKVDRQQIEQRVLDDPRAYPDGGKKGDRAHAEEERGERDPLALQKGDAGAAQRHEGGVVHIDRRDGAGALIGRALRLNGREGRHNHQTAGERQNREVDGGPQRAGLLEIVGDVEVGGALDRRAPELGKAEINRRGGDQQRADGGRQQHDAAGEQKGGKARAHANGDGENGEVQGDDAFPAVQRMGDERRHQRHGDGAIKPEEARHRGEALQDRFGAQRLQQPEGRAEDIGIDPQIGGGARRRGDEPGGDAACERYGHDPGDEGDGAEMVVVPLHGEAAGDRAGENGEEGRAFDQRISGGKLLPRQVVRENAVFDRSEQRAGHAEQGQRGQERRYILEIEARRREAGDADFRDAEPAGDDRLVEFVGHLAGDAGEQEEGRDENGARERHERGALGSADLREDQQHQRVLEEIIVEGRKELAPEQRRETACGQKRLRHDVLSRAAGRRDLTIAD